VKTRSGAVGGHRAGNAGREAKSRFWGAHGRGHRIFCRGAREGSIFARISAAMKQGWVVVEAGGCEGLFRERGGDRCRRICVRASSWWSINLWIARRPACLHFRRPGLGGATVTFDKPTCAQVSAVVLEDASTQSGVKSTTPRGTYVWHRGGPAIFHAG